MEFHSTYERVTWDVSISHFGGVSEVSSVKSKRGIATRDMEIWVTVTGNNLWKFRIC